MLFGIVHVSLHLARICSYRVAVYDDYIAKGSLQSFNYFYVLSV